MSSEKIKPCPFCGDAKCKVMRDAVAFMANCCCVVICHNCGATGPNCPMEEDAVNAWNRRPSPWRPIAEVDKKDGKEVLLLMNMRAGIPGKCLVGHYMEGGFCIDDHPAIDEGWYFWNGRMFDRAEKPTHFMPLPEPPKEGGGV